MSFAGRSLRWALHEPFPHTKVVMGSCLTQGLSTGASGTAGHEGEEGGEEGEELEHPHSNGRKSPPMFFWLEHNAAVWVLPYSQLL